MKILYRSADQLRFRKASLECSQDFSACMKIENLSFILKISGNSFGCHPNLFTDLHCFEQMKIAQGHGLKAYEAINNMLADLGVISAYQCHFLGIIYKLPGIPIINLAKTGYLEANLCKTETMPNSTILSHSVPAKVISHFLLLCFASCPNCFVFFLMQKIPKHAHFLCGCLLLFKAKCTHPPIYAYTAVRDIAFNETYS